MKVKVHYCLVLIMTLLLSCVNQGKQGKGDIAGGEKCKEPCDSLGLIGAPQFQGLISNLSFSEWLSVGSEYYYPVNLFERTDSSDNIYFLKQEGSYLYLIEANIIYQEKFNKIRLLPVDFSGGTNSESLSHNLYPPPSVLNTSIEVSSSLISTEKGSSATKLAEVEIKLTSKALREHRYLNAKTDYSNSDRRLRIFRIQISAERGIL
ncbi:hypothetical protein [Croceimicrobium hydrocarbonivorans]|uniref:Lipoprotein n=1 Tax=Croceimicrobium hydrocarbonivorans TaxID=2761580 RepID=A0A7H0VIE6_9FLAO|nr:hypothetical protein [Croceimicrobium hydrocarbonivorans]QNR25494.1 hypothetical protein H4K34_06545 [Croceimicrobium hydrocarbonivorans]